MNPAYKVMKVWVNPQADCSPATGWILSVGVVLDVLTNYETCRLQSLSEKCRYILADLQRLQPVTVRWNGVVARAIPDRRGLWGKMKKQEVDPIVGSWYDAKLYADEDSRRLLTTPSPSMKPSWQKCLMLQCCCFHHLPSIAGWHKAMMKPLLPIWRQFSGGGRQASSHFCRGKSGKSD